MACRCTLSHLNLHLCCVSSCRPQQQSVSERPADRHRPAAVLQHRRRSRPPRHPETPVWHPRWKRRHVSVSENQSEHVSPLRFVWWLHVFVSPPRPLHLAVIHHQTGVIQQLIHTLLSSQQQGIVNTANHLQQVSSSPSCLFLQKRADQVFSAGEVPGSFSCLRSDRSAAHTPVGQVRALQEAANILIT